MLRATCCHVGSSKLGLERLGGRKALATRNRFQPSRSSGRGLSNLLSLLGAFLLMAAASARTKNDSNTCTCPACPPRKRFAGHSQPCSRLRRRHIRFGTYCQGCAMHYMCRRCNYNAVPGNIPDQICEDCKRKRCHCPIYLC